MLFLKYLGNLLTTFSFLVLHSSYLEVCQSLLFIDTHISQRPCLNSLKGHQTSPKLSYTLSSLNIFFFPHFMSLITPVSILLYLEPFSFTVHTFHFINYHSTFKDQVQASYPLESFLETRALQILVSKSVFWRAC